MQREVADGVEILAVRGPVRETDAQSLAMALGEAIALQPRAVLVDLCDSEGMSDDVGAVLASARAAAPGWPRPALVVCCAAHEQEAGLRERGVEVHADRQRGLGHADDRSGAPRERVSLEPDRQSPQRARAAAHQISTELPQSVRDDINLIVSELVTNAVRHAEPPIEFEIEVSDREVLIAVADGSPGRPGAGSLDDDAEGGRGLQMVRQLADEMGVRPQPPGKTVWASIARSSR